MLQKSTGSRMRRGLDLDFVRHRLHCWSVLEQDPGPPAAIGGNRKCSQCRNSYMFLLLNLISPCAISFLSCVLLKYSMCMWELLRIHVTHNFTQNVSRERWLPPAFTNTQMEFIFFSVCLSLFVLFPDQIIYRKSKKKNCSCLAPPLVVYLLQCVLMALLCKK